MCCCSEWWEKKAAGHFRFCFVLSSCFCSQADVTPERQAVLDRLSSGQVFRPSASAATANGNDGKEGSGVGGGSSSYGNGGLRLPGDPPAQPNFVGGTRCALAAAIVAMLLVDRCGDGLHKGYKLTEDVICRGPLPHFNAQAHGE